MCSSNGKHVDIHEHGRNGKGALQEKRPKAPSPTSSSVHANALNSSLDFLSNISLDVGEGAPRKQVLAPNNQPVKSLPKPENAKNVTQAKPQVKAVTILENSKSVENGRKDNQPEFSVCELSPNYKASVDFLNNISLDAVPENHKQTTAVNVDSPSPSLYSLRKSGNGTNSNLKIQLPEVFRSPGMNSERCVIEITGGLPVCSNTPSAVERCASLPLQCSGTPANLIREKSARESLDFLTNISLGAPATGAYDAYSMPRSWEESSKLPAPSPRCENFSVGSPQKYIYSRNQSADLPPPSPKLLPKAKQLSFSEVDSTPPPKWSNKMEWGTFEGFMGSIGMGTASNRRKVGLGADLQHRQFKNKQDWERRHIGGFLLVPRNQSERKTRVRKARRSFGSYQDNHEGDSYEDPATEGGTGTRSARSSIDSEECNLQDRCIFPLDEQRQVEPHSLVSQEGQASDRKERGREVVLSEGHCNLALFSNLSSAHLLDSRIMLYPQDLHAPAVVTGALRAPISVFSVIKFRQDDFCPQGDPGEIVHSVETQLRLKHGSYAELLERRSSSDSGSEDEKPKYNPYFLDDPEMRISKDRTVIKQEGYMVSCIPYVKPLAMKEELNGLFLAKHGDWLEGREMTLSKIRALKADIVTVVKILDFELSTAAMAHVYLEKLILKNLVRKHRCYPFLSLLIPFFRQSTCEAILMVPLSRSRKVTAAVCLLLAVKFNEVPRDTRVCAIQVLFLGSAWEALMVHLGCDRKAKSLRLHSFHCFYGPGSFPTY
eukprot:767087-Hanusia_phi.AAC.1